MLARLFRFLIATTLGLLGLALTALVALDQFYPQNPWTGGIKGQALVLTWDRQSPLVCSGYSIMVVEGRNLDRSFGPLFEASGHCQLRLQDVQIKAPRIVVARDDARIVIAGGRLEATTAVLELSDRAEAKIEGAQLVGPQKREGSARIEGVSTAR